MGQRASKALISSSADGVTKPRGYGVELVQPLFRGFRTCNAVNEAEANVRAEREVLRDVERIVLLQAATAYMDVVRDQQLVRRAVADGAARGELR